MFKMPEPIGCGYVVKWSSGDTHSTYKEGYANILGADVFTADQLNQAVRDALEEAARVCDYENTAMHDKIAEAIRDLKDQL